MIDQEGDRLVPGWSHRMVSTRLMLGNVRIGIGWCVPLGAPLRPAKAKSVTTSIPIVFINAADPVQPAGVSGREVTWLLRRLFGSGQRAGTLCFFRRDRQCMIGAAEPRQSCKPLSVLICAEHDVSVLGSSFETALLKFFK
jgi:hypothetical protein